MRIGFDIDGVLAAFVPAYQALTVRLAGGDNKFHPDDIINPPCWNWPEFRGYSDDLMKQVWGEIVASPNFWRRLLPISMNVNALELVIESLEHRHDVYFITSRPGMSAKRQTEGWLTTYLLYDDPDVRPTVLLASDKGAVAKALKLDCYLDDNLDNIKSVLRESPKTRAYLLNRSYNRGEAFVYRTPEGRLVKEGENITNLILVGHRAIRVNSLAEMLDAELANL